MRSRRVLISGASIAGPVLAYWLARYGWDPTVIERAAQLRVGGQNIDIRGAGREVARRMGLEDAVRAGNTGEVGTRFVGARGQTIAEFPAGEGDSDGATAELEILRGDLARLLVDHTSDIPYIYGDHIAGLRDGGDYVDVSFTRGPDKRFDLVIAADGINSTTRRMAFGDEATIASLGMYVGWFTIPRVSTDDPWWRWYSASRGRTATLRPDNHGTTRAALSFMTAVPGLERRPTPDQLALLRRGFAGTGWETDRILSAMGEADDFTFERVAQVRAPRWSNGRVGLVGDAAYCASPVSGMGTSLAFTGAYVLAGELARHDRHEHAFAAYERIMRPYVAEAQDLPPGTPRIANPRTRAGIAALHAAVRLAATRPGRRLTAGLFTPPAERIDLPDYGHPVGTEIL